MSNKKRQDKKAVEAQQAAMQAEIEKRSAKIGEFIDELMKLSLQRGLTVNDLKLVLNQVARQLENVFNTRELVAFVDDDLKIAAGLMEAPKADAPIEQSSA